MRGISARLSGLQQQFLQRISSANDAAALNAVRLTTGKKINTPADDPSGFVALYSLETELAAINETVARVSAAADLVAQAQLTLDQSEATLTAIRDLLITDEGRVLDSSGRAAAQAEIDAALDDLNGFAATEINGRRVLDGSASFRPSGVNTSQIASLRVFTTAGVDVEGSVIQSATQATLTYTGTSGQITDDADITLTGATGNISLSVVSGTSLADVAADINDYSHLSGVTAEADGDDLIFTAVEAGSANTVEVAVGDGTFTVTGGDGNGVATGTDAEVEINGATLSGTQSINGRTHGDQVTYVSNGLHLTLQLEAGFTGDFDAIEIDTSNALQFSLSNKTGDLSTLGIQSVQTLNLGGVSGVLESLRTGGDLSGLEGNTSQAIRVVDEALAKLRLTAAQVDAFGDRTIASSAALYEGLATRTQESIDSINQVDETAEQLLLAENQAISSNALASLSILQQQNFNVTAILSALAGF